MNHVDQKGYGDMTLRAAELDFAGFEGDVRMNVSGNKPSRVLASPEETAV